MRAPSVQMYCELPGFSPESSYRLRKGRQARMEDYQDPMKPTRSFESYIANRLVPGFRFTLELDRSRDIGLEQENRCLSPVGRAIYMDALLGYLAGCRKEADELLSRAEAFLELAHAIGEEERYSYAAGFSQGVRSAALSHIKWLLSGARAPDLLAEARFYLESYCDQSPTLDRKDAENMTPMLLYLNAYGSIVGMARRLGIITDRAGRIRVSGLFGHAWRIATAPDEPARQIEKEMLKKKIGKQLFIWIDTGHYDSVAYLLFAMFPVPEDRPSRLIEECWQYVPVGLIQARGQEKQGGNNAYS